MALALPIEDRRPFRAAMRALELWQVPGFILFAAGLAFSISFTNYALFAFVLLPFLIQVDLRRRAPVYRTPLDLSFAALYGSMVLSSATAYLVGGADFGNRSFQWTFTYTAPVIYYTICFTLPGKPWRLWVAMAAALFVAAAAHGGVAVWQCLRAVADHRDLYTVRPSGRMFYMTYGGVMMLLITFALAVLIKAPLRLKWRLALGALTVVMTAGLAASLVRSAWVGLAVAIFVIAVVADRRLLWAFPAVVAVAVLIAPRPILHRAESILHAATGQTEGEGPPEFRVDIWRTTLRIARDYPLTGVGLHNTIELYDHYKDADAIESRVPHAHNNYIQLIVERGVVGFAAFAYFIYVLCALFLRTYRRARAPATRVLALAGIGAMAGFLVAGFFEYTFGDYEIMAVIYALAAVVTVAARAEAGEGPPLRCET